MEAYYKQSFFLSASEANAEQELSMTNLISKLIDIATCHANSLEIGNPNMTHLNGGWVLARLTVEMHSYPMANENYSIYTWIESFNKHFSIRCFKITDEKDNIKGYARSIWMVMNTKEHTNIGLSHFNLPSHLISGEKVPIEPQAKHITHICKNEEEMNENKNCLKVEDSPFLYKFQYCDLDFYRHVNTVRYVTLILNQFPLEKYDRQTIRRLELSFLHEAKYGMKTLLYKSKAHDENIYEFALVKESDEQPLLYSKLIFGNRNN